LMALSWPSQIGTAVRIRTGEDMKKRPQTTGIHLAGNWLPD